MKKLMLTVALATFIGGGAFAQSTEKQATTTQTEMKTAAQSSAQLTDQMTRQLKLTPDQVPRVKAINDAYSKQVAHVNAERKAANASTETMEKPGTVPDLKEATAKQNSALKEVLTPEQMTEWSKMQKEGAERAKTTYKNKTEPKKQ